MSAPSELEARAEEARRQAGPDEPPASGALHTAEELSAVASAHYGKMFGPYSNKAPAELVGGAAEAIAAAERALA